jgi:hypothetical protein
MTQERPKVVKPSIESQPSQSPSILYTRLDQQLGRASNIWKPETQRLRQEVILLLRFPRDREGIKHLETRKENDG